MIHVNISRLQIIWSVRLWPLLAVYPRRSQRHFAIWTHIYRWAVFIGPLELRWFRFQVPEPEPEERD